MKKICTLIILILSIASLHAFTVSTSRGDVELAVPSDMTLEEAYIEMARLYLEERYDHEDLIEATERQTTSVSSYIVANKELRDQYQDLLVDYNNLVEEMNKEIKSVPLKGFVGMEVDFEEQFTIMKPSILLGGVVFERVLVTTRVGYPWSLGIGVGFTF